jgi:uncharacterized protein YqeY
MEILKNYINEDYASTLSKQELKEQFGAILSKYGVDLNEYYGKIKKADKDTSGVQSDSGVGKNPKK